MRISETDNLPGITGIGENFLVSGEAGIENDFPATARARPGSLATKDAPVLERKCRAKLGQWSPL